jgi:hypothetical protein
MLGTPRWAIISSLIEKGGLARPRIPSPSFSNFIRSTLAVKLFSLEMRLSACERQRTSHEDVDDDRWRS